MVYGSVLGSFTVERFGLERLLHAQEARDTRQGTPLCANSLNSNSNSIECLFSRPARAYTSSLFRQFSFELLLSPPRLGAAIGIETRLSIVVQRAYVPACLFAWPPALFTVLSHRNRPGDGRHQHHTYRFQHCPGHWISRARGYSQDSAGLVGMTTTAATIFVEAAIGMGSRAQALYRRLQASATAIVLFGLFVIASRAGRIYIRESLKRARLPVHHQPRRKCRDRNSTPARQPENSHAAFPRIHDRRHFDC